MGAFQALMDLIDLTRAMECCNDQYCKDCPYRDTVNCYNEWLKRKEKEDTAWSLSVSPK